MKCTKRFLPQNLSLTMVMSTDGLKHASTSQPLLVSSAKLFLLPKKSRHRNLRRRKNLVVRKARVKTKIKQNRKGNKNQRNLFIGRNSYPKVPCLWMLLKNYFSISNHLTKSFSITSGILLMLKDTAFFFKSIIIILRIPSISKPKTCLGVIFSVLNPVENLLLVLLCSLEPKMKKHHLIVLLVSGFSEAKNISQR